MNNRENPFDFQLCCLIPYCKYLNQSKADVKHCNSGMNHQQSDYVRCHKVQTTLPLRSPGLPAIMSCWNGQDYSKGNAGIFMCRFELSVTWHQYKGGAAPMSTWPWGALSAGSKGNMKVPSCFLMPFCIWPTLQETFFFPSLANLTLQHKALLHSCSPVGVTLYYDSSYNIPYIFSLKIALLVMLFF